MSGVNYNDERFLEVEVDKNAALTENEQLYGGMISDAGKFYEDQMNAADQWAEEQKKLQQEKTDFTLEKIEQQKEQANKDYLKEQQGSYVDYKKQTSQHGANAEQMAVNGLGNTGYSESSKVSMFNTYQNRVAAAREVYSKAVLEYDNAMKEAMLQNNSALAEIAMNALKEKLQYALEGFQYKNTLLLDQANKKTELDNIYYGRYQDVLEQINRENELAEQKRQYEEQMAYQKQQDALNYQLQLKQLEEEKRQFNAQMAAAQAEKEAEIDRDPNGTKQVLKTPLQAQIESLYGTGIDQHGNSSATTSKSDYYFDNGYQPRYVNDKKLSKTGYTVGQVCGNKYGVNQSQNVWIAGGKVYIWIGSEKNYIDVTADYQRAVKSGLLTTKKIK